MLQYTEDYKPASGPAYATASNIDELRSAQPRFDPIPYPSTHSGGLDEPAEQRSIQQAVLAEANSYQPDVRMTEAMTYNDGVKLAPGYVSVCRECIRRRIDWNSRFTGIRDLTPTATATTQATGKFSTILASPRAQVASSEQVHVFRKQV